MKLLLLTPLLIFHVSCAVDRGATYAGNGDAGGGNVKLSDWSSYTFGTDRENMDISSGGMKYYKQDQSKVANNAIKVGGQAVAAYVGADVIKSITSSNNAVTTTESAHALRATQAKEATKQVGIKSKAQVESLKLLEAAKP